MLVFHTKNTFINFKLSFIISESFLPESATWLYAKNKKEQADAIVRRMAQVNKVTLPDKLEVHVKVYIVILKRLKSYKKLLSKYIKRFASIFNFNFCHIYFEKDIKCCYHANIICAIINNDS